jgi:hypothetical protein
MLDVEDILNDTIDERSVMAYISTMAYNFQVANGLIRSNSGVQLRSTLSHSTSTDELDESEEMQIEDVASFTWEELHIEVWRHLLKLPTVLGIPSNARSIWFPSILAKKVAFSGRQSTYVLY